MDDVRQIARSIVFEAVGPSIDSVPAPEDAKLGEFFPTQRELDVFIMTLQAALRDRIPPHYCVSLETLKAKPDESVREVIEMVAGLLLRARKAGSPGAILTCSVDREDFLSGIKTRDFHLTAKEMNATCVRIFYATDRKETVTNYSTHYTAKRSDKGILHYGECTITIPRIHKIGRLESPNILRLEFIPDPKRHIVLKSVESLAEEMFFQNVAASVAKAPAKDAFVFIHGYNVLFENAARRTGQIAFDLHFVGAPIFYSWPANGKTKDYLKDETNITWTVPHFERFLGLLAKHSGAARIHIIAHSMGNRAVCDALKHIRSNPDARLKFNHLVLAAPDIDAEYIPRIGR